MNNFDAHAIDHFTQLYSLVENSFDQVRREMEEALRRPGASIRWHFVLVFLIVLLSWFFGPGLRIMTQFKDFLQMVFPADGVFFTFLLVFGFAGWVIGIALISSIVYRSRRSLFILLYSAVVLPVLPLLLTLAPFFTRGIDVWSALISWVFWSTLSLAGWLLMYGFLWMVSGGIPRILFMVLLSFSRGGTDALIPRYVEVVKQSVCNVGKNDSLDNLTTRDWQRVGEIVRWRFDSVNGQVQTVSFGIGALGLTGIVALVLSQDHVRAALDWAWSALSDMLGAERSAQGESVIIAIVGLGMVVFVALVYFTRAYVELRLLEAIGIICSLASGNTSVQVVQSPAIFHAHPEAARASAWYASMVEGISPSVPIDAGGNDAGGATAPGGRGD